MVVTENITISVDADWDEAGWLLDGNLPADLTGKRGELFVLPAFDWEGAPIRVLNSDEGGEIIVDNASKGARSIFVTQANVDAHIPVGVWKYFERWTGNGEVIERRRGTLTVLAGRTS
jgi:hypothetical protein